MCLGIVKLGLPRYYFFTSLVCISSGRIFIGVVDLIGVPYGTFLLLAWSSNLVTEFRSLILDLPLSLQAIPDPIKQSGLIDFKLTLTSIFKWMTQSLRNNDMMKL